MCSSDLQDKFEKIDELWTRFKQIQNKELPQKQTEMREMHKNSSNWTEADRVKYEALGKNVNELKNTMNILRAQAVNLQKVLNRLN